MPTGFSYPCKTLKRAGIIHKGGRTVYRSCRPANVTPNGRVNTNAIPYYVFIRNGDNGVFLQGILSIYREG